MKKQPDVVTRSTKPNGRPIGSTKLNQRIQDTIVTAVRHGNYLETAAALAGIHRDTLYTWIRKGVTAKTEDKFKAFSDMLSRAMAQSETEAVAAINEAGMGHPVTRYRTAKKPLIENGRPVLDDDGKPVYIEEIIEESTVETDWRALAWRLERRFPRRWGRREYLETSITEKPVEEMTDAEIDAELTEILEKGNEE